MGNYFCCFAEPFESKFRTLWAFLPKHFSMDFLGTRPFSYITTMQLARPGTVILTQCYYLIYSPHSHVAICPITSGLELLLFLTVCCQEEVAGRGPEAGSSHWAECWGPDLLHLLLGFWLLALHPSTLSQSAVSGPWGTLSSAAWLWMSKSQVTQ